MRITLIISVIFISQILFSQTLILDENFENGFPSAWTQSGAGTWEVREGEEHGYPDYSYSGSNNITLFNNSVDGARTKLVTSIIDFSTYTNGRLEFFFTNDDSNGGNYDDLRVYYSTNANTGPWTEIVYLLQSNTYKKQLIDLPNVNSTYYIAFESENWNAYGICIDDVNVFGTNEQASPTGTYCDASTVNGPSGVFQITGFALNEIRLQAPSTAGFTYNYPHVGEHSFGQANIIAGQYHHFQFVDGYAGTTYDEMLTVWIDYNGDGDFNDAGEKIDEQMWTYQGGNAKAVYFDVPSDAKVGKTRLRIRSMYWSSSIDPCNSYNYGQTFDFDVFIHPSIGPKPEPFDGSNNIHSMGEQVYITKVQLGNINNSSSYFGTSDYNGNSVGYNYSNFMGQYSTIVEEGKTYNLSIEHTGYTSTFGVWIDWNNDGDFLDADEEIDVFNDAVNNPITMTVTVPSGLPNYNKYIVMRTRIVYDNVASSMTPTNIFSGLQYTHNETEDYKLYLVPKDYLLPVEWLSFEANKENTQARLEWATSTETNNDYFVIEHSVDAELFAEIERIKGAGNSNVINEYNLLHSNPQQGNNYYRIKQVDYDGKFSYSEIRSLYFDQVQSLSVFPNPTSDFVQINGLESVTNFTILIKDVSGKPVIQSSQNRINISKLSKGIYTLEVQFPTENKIFKLIKN